MSKIFFKRLILFLLPIALLMALPLYVLVMSGEFADVSRVIVRQGQDKPLVLYGPIYSNETYNYKFNSWLQRKPEVVVLGDSRTFEIRSVFFRDPQEFYNAGSLATDIYSLRKVLDALPRGAEPKVLIVSVFPQSFCPSAPDDFSGNDVDKKIRQHKTWDDNFSTLISNWPKMYGLYFSHKYSLAQVASDHQRNYGISPLIYDSGFRNDGSYRYGQYIKTGGEQLIDPAFDRGWCKQKPGAQDEVNKAGLAELERFLAECRRRNIHVVGYLPPFAQYAFDAVKAKSEYAYLFAIEKNAKPVFAKYGFSLFNFLDMSRLGASSSEAIDSAHGSEKLYLRVMIKMAEGDKQLRSLVDLPWLKAKLNKPLNKVEVFGE